MSLITGLDGIERNPSEVELNSTFDQQTAYLDDPHGQAGLFGQLLSDVPRRLRRLRESVLQDLQLFRLDGGARSAPLRSRPALIWRLGLAALVVAPRLALAVAVHRS